MNYSENESMCRVSIFKPSGKWYQDVAIDMGPYYSDGSDFIHDAVISGLEAIGITIHDDWMYVCLDPYHKFAHPVMIKR